MTNTMTKKESIKMIHKAYDALECLNNISWSKYRDRLYDMNKQGEKQHDKVRPESCSRGLSISDSAKLFTVCWIAGYLIDTRNAPDAKDYINMRSEAFYAYSVSQQYGKEILKAWAGMDIKAIASLDYAELQKTDNN